MPDRLAYYATLEQRLLAIGASTWACGNASPWQGDDPCDEWPVYAFPWQRWPFDYGAIVGDHWEQYPMTLGTAVVAFDNAYDYDGYIVGRPDAVPLTITPTRRLRQSTRPWYSRYHAYPLNTQGS